MTDSYNQGSINLADNSLGNTPFEFLVGMPGSGAPFNSIQDAIDAAGDRTIETIANVIVLGGQYNEDVNMRRAVAVNGFGGAQIRGTVTFDLPAGTVPPDDNVGLFQNMLVEPPSGTGIVVTGTDYQNVVINNILIDSINGGGIEFSNTGLFGGNGSALLCNSAQVNSNGFPALVQTAGFGFFSDTSFGREDSGFQAIDITGGGHVFVGSRINGDINVGAGAAFTNYSYVQISSNLQPAVTVDSFASLEQCTIQCNASPAITGTGGLVYTGLVYAGGGRGIDSGFAFVADPGQAYQPFLPGAAAAWALPIPETLGEAVDRIAVALASAVAPGGGIPPF